MRRNLERSSLSGYGPLRSWSSTARAASKDFQTRATFTKEASPSILIVVSTFSGGRPTDIVISDAVHQLQCRIQLVDGVINIGFGEKCDYSMKVYIPAISNQHTPRVQQRSITLLRRDVKQLLNTPQVDLKKETVTWLLSVETLE